MAWQLEDVELIAETDKAILVREADIEEEDAEQDVNQWWIPKSVIEGSDLENKGDVGCLEVTDWFAKKMEWSDED